MDTSSLGLLEVFQQLLRLEYGTFVPVRDKGVDVVGFNPKRGKFVALQVKTSKQHLDRYKAKGGEYGYWWEVPQDKHSEVKGDGVFYVFVGLGFDVKDRNILHKDFFIIESSELEEYFSSRKIYFNSKSKIWRIELYLDSASKRFLCAHDNSCDFSAYHNSWVRLR